MFSNCAKHLPTGVMLLFLLNAPVSAQEQPTVAQLDPAMAANQAAADDGLRWYDASDWGVEGRILPDQERLRWYDRLPG
ncbi:MAG: hypothetical protein KDB22_27250 [Planctomycetales bacterium]|nr:hypothetical protein [Planctomycetales bacterium]